ncbi:Bgt-50513 [Blumeria graminis f. sp. tritici]|uniref:Bgt-50513 n=1 Tax=Blumeria graminis f. sp. tritici TaxID=62690 RepID=A0A9X9MIR8_BLUGR|nr:Bgt-50513 [Blumeria graminis f. sp. tritici]
MHSNRLISCLGIWLISIIAVVQCYTNYRCGNGVEITENQARTAHGNAMKYLSEVAAFKKPPIESKYRGNIGRLPFSTYFWYITHSLDPQGQVVMKYYLLTSSNGEFLMIISTGRMKEIGEEDTWCPGT